MVNRRVPQPQPSNYPSSVATIDQDRPRHIVLPLAICLILSVILFTGQLLHSQSRPIRVGVVYDLTGPLMAVGQDARLGAQAVADLINRDGGILGRKLELIYEDGESKPAMYVARAQKLLRVDHVDMLAGLSYSAGANALAPLVEQEATFLWITNTSPDFGPPARTRIFRLSPSVNQISKASIDFLSSAQSNLPRSANQPSLAILYEKFNGFESPIAAALEANARQKGLAVTKASYVSEQQNLSSAVSRLVSGRPDVLLHVPYSQRPSLANEWRNLSNLGTVQALIWFGSLDDPESVFRNISGSSLKSYVVLSTPPALDAVPTNLRNLASELIQQYATKRGGARPSAAAIEAASHMWTLFDNVVRRALSRGGGSITADSLVAAAREMNIEDGQTLVGYGVRFYPQSDTLSGQNQRASGLMFKYSGARAELVFPVRPQAPRVVSSGPYRSQPVTQQPPNLGGPAASSSGVFHIPGFPQGGTKRPFSVRPPASGPSLPSIPMDPLDPLKEPAPPGSGSEGIAGVPSSASPGTGSMEVLSTGTAPTVVVAALQSQGNQAFIRACDPWAKAMKALRQRWGVRDPALSIPNDELADALRTFDSYDQNCLARLPDLDPTLAMPGAQTYLAKRIGVLARRGTPVCTATWVGPTWILTARHCLFTVQEDLTQPDGFKYDAVNIKEYSFQLDGTSSAPVQIINQINTSFYNKDQFKFVDRDDLHDQVILVLSGSPGGTFPGLRLREPQQYDRIVLYAFQRNASIAQIIREKLNKPNITEERTTEIIKDWTRWMRFDAHQTCRIAATTNGGCLPHACQTELQTSGAPLFRLGDAGTLELVGLHIRPTVEHDSGKCLYTDSKRVPNVAIHIDATLVDLISKIPENRSHSGKP